MKIWRIVFLLSLLLGFLFISPVWVKAQSTNSPPFDFPTTGLGEGVEKESLKELTKDLWSQYIFVKRLPGNPVADWYKQEAEKAGWQVEEKRKDYEITQRFTRKGQFLDTEIRWGFRISERPNGRSEDDSDIDLEWGTQAALGSYYGVVPLVYPGAEKVSEPTEIDKPFIGYTQTFKTKMVMGAVLDWYEKKLTKVGWQIAEKPEVSGGRWLESFARGSEKLIVGTDDFRRDPLIFSLQWTKKEKELTATPLKEEEPSDLEKQIVEDLLVEKPSLRVLLRQYYFYRHKYNEKAGVSALLWLGRAALWEPTKTIWTTLLGIKNLFKVYELAESLKGFLETVGETGNLVLHGDFEDAAVLTALNMPDERFPIPFVSLFFGISKTEFLRWRAGNLYKEVVEKLKTEDPNYCVFKETYQGKENCYNSWLQYRNAFQPEESIFFPGKLPRSVEETEKAEKIWQEKTKFGEFSDGAKYTVKELTGEDWQDAFEDVSWPKREHEKKEKETLKTTPVTTPTPTQPSPTTTGPMKNVALQANGGKATADSFGSYAGIKATAEKGNDGDKNNFWGGTGTPGWYQVEFDKTYSISKIVIYTYYHTQTFNIELSKDGNSWTKVVSETRTKDEKPSGEGENDEKTFEITPTEAKYIKVNILETDAPGSHIWQEAIIELEAYTSSQGKEAEKTGAAKIITVAEFEKLPKGGQGCNEKIVMRLKPTAEHEMLYDDIFPYDAKDDTGTMPVYTKIRRLMIDKTYELKGCKSVIGTGGPDMASQPGEFYVDITDGGSIVDLGGSQEAPAGVTTVEKFLDLPVACDQPITMQLKVVMSFNPGGYHGYRAIDDTGVIDFRTNKRELGSDKTYQLKGCKVGKPGEVDYPFLVSEDLPDAIVEK